MLLIDLPNVVLIEVFEFLTYEEISKHRLVCRRFDQVCQQILNGGFNKVVRQHAINFRRIKALLPRRESERRNHCLARHADILTSIETRISMLSMTYSKYMDLNLCCFIPGRVLDEIFYILRLISKSTKPLRPHEVLQELRDISSMAIEHFDEKISSTLKKSYLTGGGKMCNSPSSITESRRISVSPSISVLGLNSPAASCASAWSATPASSVAVNMYNKYTYCCSSERQQRVSHVPGEQSADVSEPNCRSNHCNAGLECQQQQQNEQQELKHCCANAGLPLNYLKKLETNYNKSIQKIRRMRQTQVSQSRRLQRAISCISDLNARMIEFKKRLEDVDAKNREISANIKQINTGEPSTVSSGADNATNATSSAVVMPTFDNVTDSPTKALKKLKRQHSNDIIANRSGDDGNDDDTSPCSSVQQANIESTGGSPTKKAKA